MKRKAVSPVIATVILVAVAITISVAVAYWMGNVATSYTGFESVEIWGSYSDTDKLDLWGSGAEDCWTITLEMRNRGTNIASIIRVSINGKPPASYGNVTGADTLEYPSIQFEGGDLEENPVKLEPGASGKLVAIIKDGTPGFASGSTVEILLNSARGMSYPKMVSLS